jgi:23S rRNA (cytidine1920-2'-O)/16S rRNA (cytidine1409-2'-O)-methyltransferase
VEKGFASSRNRAQELIDSGRVRLRTPTGLVRIAKSSQKLRSDDELVVEAGAGADAYVSRGGVKLRGALDHVGLSVTGLRALDIGLSTGGFTDCLLQAGVSSVVGLDVGRDQLAESLKKEPRLQSLEGVNARDLSSIPLLAMNAGHKFDLIVIDVSFISLVLVLPQAIQYLHENGRLLALVKPQFEVGREGLGKNGIVKDPSLYAGVEVKVRKSCESLHLEVEDYFASSIEGSDGNREFFLFAHHARGDSR